jgi:glycosyltransferase involved in cell wall biosynthesis
MMPLVLTIVFLFVMGVAMGLLSLFKPARGKGISIIIPFRAPSVTDERVRNLEWLKKYWKHVLPGAELIISDDPEHDRAFSKSVAINRGVARSSGDILMLIDADGYLPAEHVLYCAEEMRNARKRGRKLWFVPFRKFYRLADRATRQLIKSDFDNLHTFPEPPRATDLINLVDANPSQAHWYGALVQMMPREAFDLVGGWDERFRGWGGEDHAAMRAMDTLYVLHKTLPFRVFHLWHPMLGDNGKAEMVTWKERRWEGQDQSGINNALSYRYYDAHLKPELMRRLVDEWIGLKRWHKPYPPKPVDQSPLNKHYNPGKSA